MSTNHLEALFVTVLLLQKREYLFAETFSSHSPLQQRTLSAVKSATPIATTIGEKRESFIGDPSVNLLVDMKV
jgi:hypothetical protein